MSKQEIDINTINVLQHVAYNTQSRLCCNKENKWTFYKHVELRIRPSLYDSLYTGFRVSLIFNAEKSKLSITFLEPGDLERLLNLHYGDKESFDDHFESQIEQAVQEANNNFPYETIKDGNNLRCEWDTSDLLDSSYKTARLHHYLCYLIDSYALAISRTSEWI